MAYILITAEPLKEHSVYNTLFSLDVIDYIYPLFGEWDMICRVHADTKEEVSTIIVDNISPIDGVLATKTLFGM